MTNGQPDQWRSPPELPPGGGPLRLSPLGPQGDQDLCCNAVRNAFTSGPLQLGSTAALTEVFCQRRLQYKCSRAFRALDNLSRHGVGRECLHDTLLEPKGYGIKTRDPSASVLRVPQPHRSNQAVRSKEPPIPHPPLALEATKLRLSILIPRRS